MANTKIPVELSSTPGIVDNSNATALTINSSENAKFEGLVGINKDINASVALSVGADATSSTSYGLEVTNSTANTRFLVNGEGSSIFYKTDNAEGMRFNASTGGLTFGGDTAAANTLDDYETGTWTPAFQGATGIAYSEQTGYYIKIGDQVTLSFRMNVTTAPTSGSNIYIIMPYNPKGTGTGVAGTRWSLCTGTTLSDSVAALTGIANYASVANFYQYNSKNGSGYFNYTHFGTGLYSATLTYRID